MLHTSHLSFISAQQPRLAPLVVSHDSGTTRFSHDSAFAEPKRCGVRRSSSRHKGYPTNSPRFSASECSVNITGLTSHGGLTGQVVPTCVDHFPATDLRQHLFRAL